MTMKHRARPAITGTESLAGWKYVPLVDGGAQGHVCKANICFKCKLTEFPENIYRWWDLECQLPWLIVLNSLLIFPDICGKWMNKVRTVSFISMISLLQNDETDLIVCLLHTNCKLGILQSHQWRRSREDIKANVWTPHDVPNKSSILYQQFGVIMQSARLLEWRAATTMNVSCTGIGMKPTDVDISITVVASTTTLMLEPLLIRYTPRAAWCWKILFQNYLTYSSRQFYIRPTPFLLSSINDLRRHTFSGLFTLK